MIDENSRIGFIDGQVLKFSHIEDDKEVWVSLTGEELEKIWVEEYPVEVIESPEYVEQCRKDFEAFSSVKELEQMPPKKSN